MLDLEGFHTIEVIGARSPGWYETECLHCHDEYHGTDGLESVVEDWAYQHMADYHPRRLRRVGYQL